MELTLNQWLYPCFFSYAKGSQMLTHGRMPRIIAASCLAAFSLDGEVSELVQT